MFVTHTVLFAFEVFADVISREYECIKINGHTTQTLRGRNVQK